jgi:hypothetical protein
MTTLQIATTTTILQGPAYSIFINSLSSKKTKEKYSKVISDFARYKNVNQLDDLLVGDPKSHKAAIMGYLLELKDRGLSSSSRNGALASIKHFYEMNDVVLAWKPIRKFLGEYELENESRMLVIPFFPPYVIHSRRPQVAEDILEIHLSYSASRHFLMYTLYQFDPLLP